MQASPNALRIEQRVAKLTKSLSQATNTTITTRQRLTTHDPGVKGPVWVSRCAYHRPPENDLREVVLDAISDLGDGTEEFDTPEVRPLESEWVGWRSGVEKNTAEAPGSEMEKYEGLMKEVKSDITIFYVHGGAFLTGGPHMCRAICGTLARLICGRCYTVRYRLAPTDPFPAAIIDVLYAYLTLIAPPPGSFHRPIAPTSIVFAGDSAGASLLLSITQVMLSFAQRHPKGPRTINFYDRPTTLPLPAGLALTSPGLDQILALPSWRIKKATDIFGDELPSVTKEFPPCALWPSSPPRGHPYGIPATLLHPLASPCTAKGWKGAPPLWIAVGGGEQLSDAAKVVAMSAALDGCVVQWVEFVSMPHQWILLCKDWWQSQNAIEMWAQACVDFVKKAECLETKGRVWDIYRRERTINVRELTSLTRDEVVGALGQKAKRMEPWTGKETRDNQTKSYL